MSSVSNRGKLIDKSGSITSGGTAQVAAVFNADRNYLLIQNKSTASEPFWISFITTAVADSPSIQIVAGATLIYEGTFVPIGAISVIAATTGTKFTIMEG